MPRISGLSRAFLNLDTFREIPKDLTEPSFLGAICTLFAIMLCSTLFILELG